MKAVIIVQARMSSSRLPGKILKKVLGKPLLEYQIERLKKVQLADMIVVATTLNGADRAITNLCDHLMIPYFCGSETDVLARYYETALTYQADLIIRVTSDCPLIDPCIIDQVIQFYLDFQIKYDYVSNCLQRTFPRGMDIEVLPFTILAQAFDQATKSADREHVTPFIYRQPNRYRLGHVKYHKDVSHYRWTVDTPQDFKLIEKIIEKIYPENPSFTLEDCLRLLQIHPEWSDINKTIKQKQYGE